MIYSRHLTITNLYFKFMKKSLLLTLLFIFITSCSEELEIIRSEKEKQTKDLSNPLLIDRNTAKITPEDASNISLLFFSQENKGFKTKSQSSSNVITVKDSLDNPLFYIINYQSNNGFILISATKKYQPILAYSNEGYFDINNLNSGIELFLDSYKKNIKYSISNTSDSLRLKYAIEWSLFEKPLSEKQEKANTSTDINSLRQKEIEKWTAQGYDCHSFGAAQYLISPDKYPGFMQDICNHTYPEYDCNSVNLLLIKRTSENIGPLMRTTWNQRAPFNVDAPNKLAGCVPIAVAQIANYHQWPNSYNWNQISSYYDSNTGYGSSETTRFIKDVRNYCEVEYKSDGTASNHNKAVKAFNKLGYTAILKDFDFNSKYDVISEIRAKRPIYMDGKRDLVPVFEIPYNGHAWVCDGYQATSTQYAVAMLSNDLFMPNKPGTPEYVFHSGFTETTGYFHMNWGWGASYQGINYQNGWFYTDRANPTPEYNYQYGRHFIIVKKK